jgi:hypothetical protein
MSEKKPDLKVKKKKINNMNLLILKKKIKE